MKKTTIVKKNVTFCSSITPISSLVKLCGNRLPLTPRVSELGGLAFPTKTVRENRVGVPKNFPPRPEICHLLVGATHRARADPPKCQKTRPQTYGGKRPTLGMRAWSSNAPPRAVLGPKTSLPAATAARLYVFTSRAAAVEVPNPTKQALTDGATVDFDEPGVKRRSTCTQQPTVPNTGGARGHLGSRRAKTRVGRHLARRPAWRSVDGPCRSRSAAVKKRAAG